MTRRIPPQHGLVKSIPVPGLKDKSGAYVPAVDEKFSLDKFLFDKQLKFVLDPRPFKVAVCSRRCLAKDTLVMTSKGPTKIQDIRPGDSVYDEHGAPIRVISTFVNGPKEVVELIHNGSIREWVTPDHVFLVQNTYKDKTVQKAVKDFNSRDKILRVEVSRSGGKHVPTAYALGAMLGDGCCRQDSISRLYISSETEDIPRKVATQLRCDFWKNHHSNFTWSLNTGGGPYKYEEWCGGRYAHEKVALEREVMSWDRESRLQFLAGLIDTDGSVENLSDGLCIRLGMQAQSVISTAATLFLDLWGYKPTLRVDNRAKYKNGPIHCFGVKHNYIVKKALKELSPYLALERKRWKPEYEGKLENNFRPDRVGVQFGRTRVEETYDIHVDSPKNLYLLANGLVTHNSGKSVACAADLVQTALTCNEINCLYITLSRANAKKLVWKEILKINTKYKLGGQIDLVELSITFPQTKSTIYLSGAKDASEIEKFRGMALKKVYIDETQSFRDYIRELIEDVLDAALMDHSGTLSLIGTPGPIVAGYFAECAGVVQGMEQRSDAWSVHGWTFFDNPFITQTSGKTHQEMLQRVLTRRGVTVDDPTIQREFFGKWVNDPESLWVRYYSERSHFTELPKDKKFNYILGIDLGFNDADALAVLAWSYDSPVTYLVHEVITPKQGLTELVQQIKEVQKDYNISKMVIDEGGLGKKLAEEMRRRHALPVEAADKSRKQETVAFLNDALRTGKFKAKSASKFVQDTKLVEIDKDKSRPDKIAVSDKYHSDIIDAVLYAFKFSPAYAFQEPEKEPEKGTQAYSQKIQDEMYEKELAYLQEQANNDRIYGEYE